jgi:hypothetical protein
MAAKESNSTPATYEAKPATGPVVKFDDTGITNAYANVCNVSSLREEVVMVFGMNNAWKREAGKICVNLNSCVTLTSIAAKRRALLLNSVVQQYETRCGGMDAGVVQTDQATGK